jgi:hypothetical protein
VNFSEDSLDILNDIVGDTNYSSTPPFLMIINPTNGMLLGNSFPGDGERLRRSSGFARVCFRFSYERKLAEDISHGCQRAGIGRIHI